MTEYWECVTVTCKLNKGETMMTTLEVVQLLPWQTIALGIGYTMFTVCAIIYILTKLKWKEGLTTKMKCDIIYF